MAQSSTAENSLAKLFKAEGLKPEVQYKYVPGRKFEADFCFVTEKLIVEVDGGVYGRRAHGSISGILADMKRTNYASMNGYRVMRYEPSEITKEPARVIAEIQEALSYGSAKE